MFGEKTRLTPKAFLQAVWLATTGTVALASFGTAAEPRAPASDSIVHAGVQKIRDDLAPLIEAAQDRFRIPGISLALVRGQDVLWAEGFGYADQAREIPAGPQTVYRVGSLAKPFTAIAVMQLVESGAVDIDQPVNGYLPEFSIRSRFDTTAEPITVRSVLCHHSGLPTDLNKGMWSREPFTGVAEKLSEEYTAFPPNLVFSYSNVGYTLLGHMVQKTAGVTYPEYMQDRVFRPIGMKQTGIGPGGANRPLAKGYRGGKELDLLPMRDLPAFGLYTSAADLGVFMRAILGGGAMGGRQLLAPETLEEMFEPQNQHVELDLDIVNGLGWFLEEEGSIPGGGPVIRHGGTTLAFGSELILLPEKGLGVAVLANADGSRPIASRLAEEILSRVLDANPPPLSAGLFLAELEREAKNPPLGELAGNYATDFGLISIRPKDAKLCACIVEETFDLIPYPNGWFGIGQGTRTSLPSSFRPLAEMRFQTQRIDGKEVVVAKKGEKMMVLGEKIPPEPVPEVWLRRVGQYELVNPDDQFPLADPRLKIQEGQLCMSYKMPRMSPKTIQVPLRPVSDSEAIILGLGRTRGETLRAVTVDGEEHLRYSGFVGRKLAEGDAPDRVQ